MTRHEKDKLQRMQRRAEWLQERMLTSNIDLHYDKAEHSALIWAIEYIEKADKKLDGFSVEYAPASESDETAT